MRMYARFSVQRKKKFEQIRKSRREKPRTQIAASGPCGVTAIFLWEEAADECGLRNTTHS